MFLEPWSTSLLEVVASIGLLFFFYARARLGHESTERKKSSEHHRRRNVPPLHLRHRSLPNPPQDCCRNRRSQFRMVPRLHGSRDFHHSLPRPHAYSNRAQAPHSSRQQHRHGRGNVVQRRRCMDPPRPRHHARQWRRQRPRSQEPLSLATSAPLRHGLYRLHDDNNLVRRLDQTIVVTVSWPLIFLKTKCTTQINHHQIKKLFKSLTYGVKVISLSHSKPHLSLTNKEETINLTYQNMNGRL